MAVTFYDTVIPPFLDGLRTLSTLLKKGETWADEQSKDHSDLLNARLIPDMQDLIYQIQRVSDSAKFVAVRVAGVENVPLPDDEKTFADLYARIEKTIAILEKVKPADFEGKETKEVTIQRGKAGDLNFDGKTYVLKFAIPNFYFHVVTAYGLLRKSGVPIGKLDYLGSLATK